MSPRSARRCGSPSRSRWRRRCSTRCVGIPLAYVLARRRFWGRGLVDLVVTLPLILPPTVTGYYLIVLLGRRGVLGAPLYALDRLERRLHLVRGGDRGHRDGAAAPRAHGARRPSSRWTAISSGGAHAGALGVAHRARGDAAAGPERHPGRARAGVRARARRVRRHADARRQHPRPDRRRCRSRSTPRCRRARATRRCVLVGLLTALSCAGAGRGGPPRGAGAVSAAVSTSARRASACPASPSTSSGGGRRVVALFGPSGAGKTLTLQCLAGLVRPDAGRIVVGRPRALRRDAGVDVPPQRRRLGYVFQGYALFPHLTVRGQRRLRPPRPRAATERRRRTAEVMERLGLGGLGSPATRASCRAASTSAWPSGGRSPSTPRSSCSTSRSPRSTPPLRQSLRDELAAHPRATGARPRCSSPTTSPRRIRLGDRIVVYEDGRVIQAAAARRAPVGSPPPSSVARHHGRPQHRCGARVLKATPDRIQLRWRGQRARGGEFAHATRTCPRPSAALAFFIRPEYVRLIRKDRGTPRSPATT